MPLRPGDNEPQLALQDLLHRVYDAAGYAKYIYDEEPDPPLSAEDAGWIAQQLSATFSNELT